MSDKLGDATHALADLDACDFDAASVQDLAQLAFWCHRSLGCITLKSLGRVAAAFEARPELLHQPPAAADGRAT